MSAWGNEHRVSVSVELEEEVDASRANGTASTSRVLLKYYVIKPVYLVPKQRTGETTLWEADHAHTDCVALRYQRRELVRATTCPDAHVFYRSLRPQEATTTRSLTLSHLLNYVSTSSYSLPTRKRRRHGNPPNSVIHGLRLEEFYMINCILLQGSIPAVLEKAKKRGRSSGM